jgi:hypothetical protein
MVCAKLVIDALAGRWFCNPEPPMGTPPKAHVAPLLAAQNYQYSKALAKGIRGWLYPSFRSVTWRSYFAIAEVVVGLKNRLVDFEETAVQLLSDNVISTKRSDRYQVYETSRMGRATAESPPGGRLNAIRPNMVGQAVGNVSIKAFLPGRFIVITTQWRKYSCVCKVLARMSSQVGSSKTVLLEPKMREVRLPYLDDAFNGLPVLGKAPPVVRTTNQGLHLQKKRL